MGKSTLFESPRLLVGLNAFEPGQSHALHVHVGMDKLYCVVEGDGLFLFDEHELPTRTGDVLGGSRRCRARRPQTTVRVDCWFWPCWRPGTSPDYLLPGLKQPRYSYTVPGPPTVRVLLDLSREAAAMRRCFTYSLAVVVALVGAASLTFLPVSAQSRATATNVPVIPHEAVPNFFKNPPGIYTGENMGIATNSKGNIYIYHRANETRLFEYNPQGTFIREIGRNNYGFAFAHSVRVDAQDNIWAVDEGTDTHREVQPRGQGPDDHRPS